MGGGVLQQSTQPAFPVDQPSLIETSVAASGTLVQTGLADGNYYFRVGRPGQWSAVQELQVRHHALSTAFFYFALGLAVFLALVGVILHGSLRQGGPDA